MDIAKNEVIHKQEKPMEHYYLCPKCKSKITLPLCTTCGYEIPCIHSIYRFCNDASVKLDGEKISDMSFTVVPNMEKVLQAGKRKFAKLV